MFMHRLLFHVHISLTCLCKLFPVMYNLPCSCILFPVHAQSTVWFKCFLVHACGSCVSSFLPMHFFLFMDTLHCAFILFPVYSSFLFLVHIIPPQKVKFPLLGWNSLKLRNIDLGYTFCYSYILIPFTHHDIFVLVLINLFIPVNILACSS